MPTPFYRDPIGTAQAVPPDTRPGPYDAITLDDLWAIVRRGRR